LLSHPTLAGADVFRTLLLCRVQSFFFKADVPSLKNRHTALRLPGIPSLRMAATISSNVKSGCSTINLSKNSAYSSSGEVLPPLGFAATLPVSSQRWAQITTTLGLSSYRSAASRRDAPASMPSITRARKSLEYGRGIDCPLRIKSVPPDSLIDKPLEILPIQPDRNML
jgi:hypothetical protein